VSLRALGTDPLVEALRGVALRPGMYTGDTERGHLTPVRHSLELLWEKGAFAEPRHSLIVVSPHQVHLLHHSGPVAETIERIVPWERADLLFLSIDEFPADRSMLDERWDRFYGGPHGGFGNFAMALWVAEYGALAVRTSAGLWCQAYRRGWPVMPPRLLVDSDSRTGLMLAASFSPRWFSGLPYSPESIDACIRQAARPHVTVEWHDDDDIIRACHPDSACLLHEENLHSWL
jgi:hypothetical protein